MLLCNTLQRRVQLTLFLGCSESRFDRTFYLQIFQKYALSNSRMTTGYQPSDNFSTKSCLARTLSQSSQRSLVGSMVSSPW